MDIQDLHELVVQYNSTVPYSQRLPICFEHFLEEKVLASKNLISFETFLSRIEKKKALEPQDSGIACIKCGTEMEYKGTISNALCTKNFLKCPKCEHLESY